LGVRISQGERYNLMDILRQIAEGVKGGEDDKVATLTRQAIEHRIAPKDILDSGLIGGMNAVGEKYKAHEIFLPQVLLAAKAMYAGMDLLKPMFVKEGMPTMGKIVMGSVQGDLHDIGKNLVAIMLKGAGFEVIDLGNDVPPEKFVQTARDENAPIIGMSALLTTTMPVMKRTVDLLKEQGLGGKIRTMVGGAPVSEEFARRIGADAYGYDSAKAVDIVKELVKKA
jgi:5-methyltetrahydrofolate--homocysteine methyltransferase